MDMFSKLAIAGLLAVVPAASADFHLRVVEDGDVSRSPDSWDFDSLPDFGIIAFDGPAGPGGSGPLPAGFFTSTTIDSEFEGPNGGSRGAGGFGLVGVGPSAGFGNASNAVVANYFVDAFLVDLGPGTVEFEWTGIVLLGSTSYDLYIDGALAFPGLTSGTTYNLSGGPFTTVSMYDSTGGGAEGMMGSAFTRVPAPAAGALLGLAGLAATRRRR